MRPPARRGDVLAALADRPGILVLIDGLYYDVPAVTHKELLYALDAGVRVIGAASLGALRAAEMAAFGMVGVGRVFEAYRSGEIDGDDEVAILHGPAELGWLPVTVALVEVRHALARIATPPEAAAELIEALKAVAFHRRELPRVLELAAGHLGPAAAGDLARALGRESVKQEDARQALERALAPELPPPSAARESRRAGTGFLVAFQEAHLPGPPVFAGRPAPTVLHAWNLAQVCHPGIPDFVREVRRRHLLAAAAVHAGLPAPEEAVERWEDLLREVHEALCGRAFLPDPEVHEEARLRARAEQAREALGGTGGALDDLARRLRIDPAEGREACLATIAEQSDTVPPWCFARAFCFSTAFPAALEAAAAAEEVHRCFRRWARGARVMEEDLWKLAAELWGCGLESVGEEAVRRGLVPHHAFSDSLRDALELVAAAERLPEPINDYPERRDRLREAELDAPGALVSPPARPALPRSSPTPP